MREYGQARRSNVARPTPTVRTRPTPLARSPRITLTNPFDHDRIKGDPV